MILFEIGDIRTLKELVSIPEIERHSQIKRLPKYVKVANIK
jgi:hypothetical protein